MATSKTKKKQVLTDEKPIKYTLVKENEEKEDLKNVFQTAGKEADNLISNASYIMDSEDTTPEFLPTRPEQQEPSTPEIPQEPEKDEIRDVKNFDDLFGAFDDIDRKFKDITDADYYPEDAYKNAIPDSLNLEKYEVPEIDEEKLRSEISESETAKTEIEKNNLKQQVDKKTEKINKDIENLKTATEAQKQEVKELYGEYKVSVENDAIKRGLARSSVAILSMDNLESSKVKELSRIAENLTKSIVDAESEIASLQQDLEISLDNLDLELAENINTQLAKKIEKLEEKRNEAIKFNNNIEEMQANYKNKIADNKNTYSAIEKRLKEEYEGFAETGKKEQKLDIALNYFSTMDRTSALRTIINSPELARALGDDYYTLYYYVMRRK